jgi:hypothetical protein
MASNTSWPTPVHSHHDVGGGAGVGDRAGVAGGPEIGDQLGLRTRGDPVQHVHLQALLDAQ